MAWVSFRGVFAVIHLIALGGLITMLFRPGLRHAFERRCVGQASARDLAFVRVVVCAVLALYVLTENLPSHTRLDPAFFSLPGYMAQLGQGVCDWFFTSAARLWGLSIGVMVLLAAGAVGLWTRITLPLAAVTYLMLAALLRATGKSFHEGYLAWYVLVALALTPAGRAWSADAWLSSRRQQVGPVPAAAKAALVTHDQILAHGWMLWACYAAATVPYLQLAFSKLWSGGPFWFDGRSMRNYMLIDNLNLTEWDIDLALRLHRAPTLAFTLTGLFGLLAELLYPLVLVAPGLRTLLPTSIVLVHLGIWIGQDALFVDAVLIPLIFFGPSRWRRGARG